MKGRGLDFADCFNHWAVSPAIRRLLGIRWPGSERVGTFLFLPFGLVPAPGENEWFVRELVEKVVLKVGNVHAEVYVDDVRLVDQGEGVASREVMNGRIWGVIEGLERMGCVIRRKDGKLFEACRRIPYMGMTVDSEAMEIRVSEEKVEKGLERISRLRDKVNEGREVKAKEVLEVAGFLNYIEKIVQGGFARLRAMWRAVAESGANQEWQQSHFANPKVELDAEVGEDLGWWEKVLGNRPGAKLHRWKDRTFYWHPQLQGIRELVKGAPEGEVVSVETDAAAKEGWGAHWQGKSVRGRWPEEVQKKEINWKELWCVMKALRLWGEDWKGKLVLVRTDNKVTVCYINRGGGRIPGLSRLGKEIALVAAKFWCRLVAVWMRGESNVVADALSRFVWGEEEKDEWEERRIREVMLEKVIRQTGRIEVDAMAHEDGRNAVASKWFSKINQPFEEEWGKQWVWWAPPSHMCGRVGRFLRTRVREGKAGRPLLLLPAEEWGMGGEGWEGWKIVWKFPRGTRLWRPVRGFPPPREEETTTRQLWMVVTSWKQ